MTRHAPAHSAGGPAAAAQPPPAAAPLGGGTRGSGPAARPTAGVRDTPITVRFGEALLARGHTAVPNLVLASYSRLGVSEGEMLFTIHVWQHWWSAREPHPSVATIARRMGKSTRQVQRYIDGLGQKGLLRVVERFAAGRGDQLTNDFDFGPLLAAVVALARQHGEQEDCEEGGEAPVVRQHRVDPGDTYVAPPDDESVTPSPDRTVTPPVTGMSPKEDEGEEDTMMGSFEASKGPGTQTRPSCEAARGTVPAAGAGLWAEPGGTVPPEPRTRRPPATLPGRSQLRLDLAYQALVQPIGDLGRELGDEAPARSSVTRAYHLLQDAGVSLDEFLRLAGEAKALTRAHQAGITRTRAGVGPPRKNLMPYFFATLERLLSPAQDPSPPRTAPCARAARSRPAHARERDSDGPGARPAGDGSGIGRYTSGKYGHLVQV